MTANQRIERERGAKEERQAILRMVRSLLHLYDGKDLILKALLEDIKKRGEA